MLQYTYMIRFSLLICSLFFINSYALVNNDATKKNIPVDAHIDHPDHVPHHGGKDPVKKVTQDEIVFPRKRKKGNILIAN